MAVTQLLNRSDPEKVLFTVTNAEGAQLVNGDVVEWDTTAPLGVAVELVDSYPAPLLCGVIVETIDTGGIGRAQKWGYHSAVKTGTTVTLDTIVAATAGKVINYAASTTTVTATTMAEVMSIVGTVLVVTDTNTSGVMIRL